MKLQHSIYALSLISILFASCEENGNGGSEPPIDSNLSEEWYTGGINGTTFNATAQAYEQPSAAVTDMAAFKRGEKMFETNYVEGNENPYSGLGPVYIRSSCINCHPGYGRSKRVERYNADDYGNGYLLVVYDENGKYVSSLTGMPQTRAVAPFLPPIEESGIHIEWKNYTDRYNNTYPDGTTYSLIYPEVTIDREAINVPMPDVYYVALEGTIGIYGTGLLDAITDEDLIAERDAQEARGYCVGELGSMITEADGTSHPGRYTYGQTRGTLQNGPGANAIWNITNVTRPDRRYHYITTEYARAMAQNTDVQAALGKDEETIYNELMSTELTPEMTSEEFDDLMVWHRGLAVPAARNLDDETVKRGREIFYSIGCTACHRPTWTTGQDKYMPGNSNQKIWPYTDLLKHDLGMINPGLRAKCRTTPLWGRGLSYICAGHTDHMHDLRARNMEEAVLWHEGDALQSKEKFRELSKEDRNALIAFLNAI